MARPPLAEGADLGNEIQEIMAANARADAERSERMELAEAEWAARADRLVANVAVAAVDKFWRRLTEGWLFRSTNSLVKWISEKRPPGCTPETLLVDGTETKTDSFSEAFNKFGAVLPSFVRDVLQGWVWVSRMPSRSWRVLCIWMSSPWTTRLSSVS